MNKILTLIFIAAAFAACSAPQRVVTSNTVDLKKYSDKNFLMTESPTISREYISTGIVTAQAQSGNDKNAPRVRTRTGHYVNYAETSLEEVLELLYKEAIKSDADAIINLKYEFTPLSTAGPATWVASGMAIKFK